jgi:hypothetical protein
MMTEDSLTVTLLYPTPAEIEELRAWAAVWPLEEQSHLEICGTHLLTYLRDRDRLRIISTWDISYHLIENLLALGDTRDGQYIRVCMRFSDDPYDEVELTGTELLAEEPCMCASIEAGEGVRSLRRKEEGLEVFPHIDSFVSKANPEPWSTWLPTRCEVRGECNGVVWYGYTNCNYIVFQGYVFQNYGYHGRIAFKTLACPRCAHRELRKVTHHRKMLDRLLSRNTLDLEMVS